VVINEAGKALKFHPFRVTAWRLMTLINSPMLLVLLFCALYYIAQENGVTNKSKLD
jgi:hypothetical protein